MTIPKLVATAAAFLLLPSDEVAVAQHSHSAPVPPVLEIVVLDPGADPVGNPAVELVPGECGELEVDVPPTVLVHRYYYTGDRNFQGPMLRGGPAIVVVNHPKTGERVYVPIQLLPGSPRVTYCHNAIEYDYGNNAITLSFGLCGNPKVSYRNGAAVGTHAKTVGKAIGTGIKNYSERSGLTTAFVGVGRGTKQVVQASADCVYNVGNFVLTPTRQILSFVPLARTLQPNPDANAARIRDQQVSRAADRIAQEDVTISTVR